MRYRLFFCTIILGSAFFTGFPCSNALADEGVTAPLPPAEESSKENPKDTSTDHTEVEDTAPQSIFPELDTENATSQAIFPEMNAEPQCLPSCRSGFTCIQGQCKSPCNPQCDSTQVCTRNGHCIPSSSISNGLRLAPSRGIQAVGPDAATLELNRTKYEEFKSKKASGSALMAIGGILIGAAFGLGFAAGASGEEALLFAGIGIEVIGDLLLFPGIAVYVVGKRGMAKAQANFYTLANQVGVRVSF